MFTYKLSINSNVNILQINVQRHVEKHYQTLISMADSINETYISMYKSMYKLISKRTRLCFPSETAKELQTRNFSFRTYSCSSTADRCINDYITLIPQAEGESPNERMRDD